MSVLEQGEQESAAEGEGGSAGRDPEAGRRRGRLRGWKRNRGQGYGPDADREFDEGRDQGWDGEEPGQDEGRTEEPDRFGGGDGPDDGAEVPAPPRRAPEVRLLTGRVRRESVYTLIGALMAAVTLTQLVSHWFAPFSGLLGFLAVAYPLFLAAYCFIYSLSEDSRAVRDRLVALLTWSAALFVVCVMLAVISYPLWHGKGALVRSNTYTQDMHTTGPLDAVTSGGLQYAVIGTVEQITITMIITVPLGITCGLFLNEMPGRLADLVRTVAAAATALPSVVAGLFIYALAIIQFGLPLSGFAAGLALSIMTLPIIIRASDVVFRLVPAGLKEASFALGATRWRTALQVTVPTARSGLATAVILGAARGIGETSPVLLTAGYTTATNVDPFHNNQTSLPLATYKLVISGVPNYVARGYAAAGLLMALVLVLFVFARAVGGRGPGQLSRRQSRRRAFASATLVARYRERGLAPLPAGHQGAEPDEYPGLELDPRAETDPDWDPELERHLDQNRPDRSWPDETRPDQTRPDPTRPSPHRPSPSTPPAAAEENWEQP